MEFSSLDIVGYGNRPVPNSLLAQPEAARHLAVVLPGYRYPVDMAPLYYAGRVLFEQGADILRVEYAYYRTDFAQRPDSEQEDWLSSDVSAVVEAGLARRAYEKITLVGKSLGTMAMGYLLSDARFREADCIWMTPILAADWLCARIEEIRPRSLFIIGTADQFYRPDVLEHLVRVTGGQVCLLEGVNHGLEVPGSTSQTLKALTRIVGALQAFVGERAGDR